MPSTKIKPREIPINVPLLIETLHYIEQHPDTWDQTHWRGLPYTDGEQVKPQVLTGQRCGAALCFAGHVAALTDGKWVVGKTMLRELIKSGEDPNDWGTQLAALKPEPSDDPEWIEELDLPNGREAKGVPARLRAKHKLGLTIDETNRLFNGNNDIWRLRTLVADLIVKAAKEEAAR